MNICIRRIGVAFLYCVVPSGRANAQAGFNAKFGMETWFLKDEMEMTGLSSCRDFSIIRGWLFAN